MAHRSKEKLVRNSLAFLFFYERRFKVRKQIPGHPNYYASDDGTVMKVHKDGSNRRHPQVASKHGSSFTIKVDGKRMFIHKIIAELFVNKLDEAMTMVSHITKNKKDNRPSNLVWIRPEDKWAFYRSKEWEKKFYKRFGRFPTKEELIYYISKNDTK